MIATPATRQNVGGLLQRIGGNVAEPVGVADGDAALHAERARPCRDLLDLERTEHAAVMEMDVDIDAVLLRNAEDHVEMALDIAVEARRIEPADGVGAEPDRFVEQLRRAGTAEDPALREGHELDVDQLPIFVAHLEDGLERLQAHRAIDHDVTAHLRRAMADAEVELVARPHVHRRGGGQILGLKRRPRSWTLKPLVHGLVRPPGVAVEAGVEMDVALDEAGHDKRVAEIDDLDLGRTLVCGFDRDDAAVADQHVAARAVAEAWH